MNSLNAIDAQGPATNLPSLFTVGRSAGWKVSATVGLSIWALAVAAGLVVNFL